MRTDETLVSSDSGQSMLRILWRRRWLIGTFAIVGALVGFALSQLQPKTYTAQSRVFLSPANEFDPLKQTSYSGDPNRFVVNQAEVMTSGTVLGVVISNLALTLTPGELATQITANGSGTSDVITIEATGDTPEKAKELADAVPAAYSEFVKQKVADQVDAASKSLKGPGADAQIQDIQRQASVYDDGVSQIDQAELPVAPSAPQPVRDGLLLGIMAAVGAAAWTLFKHARQQRGGPGRHAAEVLGAPLLGEIPDRGKLTASTAVAGRGAPAAAAYTRASMALYYIRGQRPGLLLISGVREGVGASTTALNLAVSALDDGHGVILLKIDDALGRDGLDDAFGLRTPLDELADGSVDLMSLIRSEPGTRVPVLHATAPRPGRGHQVGNVRRLMELLPAGTDLVVIDSPSLLSSADSFAIAGQVDAVVAVVDTSVEDADLDLMRERCLMADVPMAGVVLNQVKRRRTFANRNGASRPTTSRAAARSGRGSAPASPAVPAAGQSPTGNPFPPQGRPLLFPGEQQPADPQAGRPGAAASAPNGFPTVPASSGASNGSNGSRPGQLPVAEFPPRATSGTGSQDDDASDIFRRRREEPLPTEQSTRLWQ